MSKQEHVNKECELHGSYVDSCASCLSLPAVQAALKAKDAEIEKLRKALYDDVPPELFDAMTAAHKIELIKEIRDEIATERDDLEAKLKAALFHQARLVAEKGELVGKLKAAEERERVLRDALNKGILFMRHGPDCKFLGRKNERCLCGYRQWLLANHSLLNSLLG